MIDRSPEFLRIGDMLRARAQILQDKPAIRFDHRVTSYRQLDRAANRVANGLVAKGIGRGDRVLYLGKNSDRYFEIFMGAARLGAVITPLNWRLAPPELADVVKDSCGRILFVEASLHKEARGLEAFAADSSRLITFGAGEDDYYARWRDQFSPEDRDWPVEPDDPVIQLYTSGTTGKPKGVVGTHRAMLVFRTMRPEAQPGWNRWTPDDFSLLVSPQFHIAGSGHGLQTICAGATGFIMREFDVDKLLHLIAHEGLTRVYAAPAVLQALLRHPNARATDFSRVRTVIYGSSPISPSLLREAMALIGCDFVQQYGMTEVFGTIAVLTPEDHRGPDESRLRSAGRALEGIDIAIVDPAGNALPPGTTGEIATRTPTLMDGYWRKPEESAEVLTPDGYYRTGDAGYLDDEGYLFIKDRIRDMIVSGGENVYPAEVESVLAMHPAVREVAVFGVPDARWGEAVKAAVVTEPGERLEPGELIDWARSRIAGYKLPKSVDFCDELPRNSTGKILRRALRDEYWGAGEQLVR